MAQGIAIITRSTDVVGRATALKLAVDGFDIALADEASKQSAMHELQREIQSKGSRCETFLADITKEDDVKSLVDDVTRELGGVDVMFVNALNLTICVKPLTSTSADDMDQSFALNTRPVFLCYKYAAEQMIKQGRGGRLIVRASTNIIRGTFPNLSSLTPALFAIRGLSQAAALELGAHNITVNAIAHGFVEDSDDDPYGYSRAMHRYDEEARNSNTSTGNKSVSDIVAARIPLPQKFVTGQDIARVVALLASRECNFMTGQTIAVNSGSVMH